MTQGQMNVTPPRQQQRGRFGRFLRALLKTLLALIVIAALVVAGWFVFQELRRSFDLVSGRMDRQSEQFTDLQGDLQAQVDQLKALQLSVANQEENLAKLQTDLSDNVSRQDEVLDALTNQIDELSTAAQTITQTTARLNDGQSALQQDVIGLGSDQDAQGGEFDNLQGEFKALQTNEAALADTVAAFEAELTLADPAGLRQAVLVFRLWELVTRARLRLAENNFGLAAADVQLGLAAIPDLLAGSSEEMAEPLQQVEQRLLMAADNLPDAPITAVNDLDIAWQELDVILNAILGLEAAPSATPAP
jgi:hypothetical protein